ncbi:MAG: methyl-accepting chemotaxis protein [Clostridiales bacterium]|nr:methyl-accepting chemotaxis protein [Clostridiales bacterium]
MKIRKLGLKVSLIVTLMIVVIIALTMWFVTISTDDLVTELAAKEAEAANIALQKTIQDLQDEAFARANMISHSADVINAILDGNQYAMKTTLLNFLPGLDVITLTDKDGVVLMRAHSNQRGDNIIDQKAISAALSTGYGIKTIEKGTSEGLVTRGSAAITGHDGHIIGAVTCGHDLAIHKYVDEIKIRNNCETTIYDYNVRMSTTILNDMGWRVVGTKATDEVVETVLVQENDYLVRNTLFGSNYYAYYSPLMVDDEAIGMLYTGVDIDLALGYRNNMVTSVLLVIIISGLACIVLVFVTSAFSISRPLKKIGHFAEKIQTGDLGISSGEVATIGIHSSDEVGAMARVLEKSYAELRGYIAEITERMQGLANGDFVTESSYEFQGDFILIKDSINNIVHNLNQTVQEVKEASLQVSSSSAQFAEGSQTLAQGAVEQAASIEELSAAIAEIRDMTERNARVAKESADLSDAIKSSAEKGSSQMDNMVQAIVEINDASRQISKVIKAINDIAFQTNILALNAAVEAARAGQHGKGFAVVADEVRDLAAKSAVAAQDTETLIANSIAKANLGLQIANETAESLGEIVGDIVRSAEIVEQIATSSDEQASAIAHVNIGIDQVAKVVQQNSMTAERSAGASEAMSGQSAILQKMISYFRIDREPRDNVR